MTEADHSHDRLLDEQAAYFDARAAEYDASMEPEPADADFEEWQQLKAGVRALRLTGDVVDLAAGTGIWTELIGETASTVTLVDAAPETLDLARSRLGTEGLTYVVADLFSWEPTRRYDVVFSSFWLCHVPPDQTVGFVDLAERACRRDGVIVVLDEHTFDDPGLAKAAAKGDDPWVSHRSVGDGREFRLVKVSHEPDEVAGLFDQRGWRTTIHHRGPRFFLLSAQPPGD